uniref:Cingulin n=1 Tax=Bos taurus TaxID=9913 RepID=A0A3Q1LY91_BOVIN
MEQASTMAEPRGPVDHGVQIRFITEPVGEAEIGTLRRGGRRPAKDARASTYGVAVRVQGIAGQPFVVLNSGEKGGDSFGVQIKGANNRGAPGALSSDSELAESPYSQARELPAPSQGSTSDEEPGAHWNGRLLRSQSQASLAGPSLMDPDNRSTSLLELAPQRTSPGNTIDTAPLSSVDSLINKFDSHHGGQSRGRTGRRTRMLPPEQRKRSQSLDNRLPRATLQERERQSPDHWIRGTKHDQRTGSSKPSAQSSLGSFSRARQTQDWVLQSFEEPRGRVQDPAVLQFKSTPDLLRDQQEAAPPGSMDHVKATIYGILREGSSESETSVRRKVSLVLEQLQPLVMASPGSAKVGQAELTQKVEELQKKLDEEVKKRQKLEPSQVGLERQLEEKAEECSRLQELLERRKGEAQQSTKELQNMKLLLDQGERVRHGLETQVMELQDKLKQAHGPEAAKEVLMKDLIETRELLEEVLEGKQRVEEQLRLRERELTALKGALKEEVASRDQEVEHVRQQYQRDTEQLRRSMQDLKKELRRTQEELKELQEEQQSQEVAGRHRERELEKQLRVEAERSRGLEEQNLQLQKTLQQLRQDCEEASKAQMAAETEAAVLGQRRTAVETTLRETQEENDEFRRRILGLEQQLKEARGLAEGGEVAEARLRDKVQRLEAEKQRLQEALNAAQEEEGSLAAAKRALEARLEEAQRGLTRLGQEQQALNRALEEEGKQREVLRRSKAELEEQKRLLDRTVDRLNKELEQIGDDSKQALQQLQAQLEDYKEKARREVADAQRQAKEWASEAEKTSGGLSRLQDETQRLRQALQASQADRDTARLDKELLVQRLQGLEQEAENKKRSQDDKSRQLKSLEEKVSRLEAELDEEKSTVELLTDRMNRGRDQVDQLRTELMQERSARQDLECDKISLERQNKDLKSRLASSEGFQKPSASLSQLESQNRELQERLQAEEREKTVLQSTNRKLERRVKELSIQIDDERQHVNDQKDQLSLRVKALKRQVDEAEEEIERLDSLRKKAQRELEEQHEVNEQLQARIKALEKDSWRKASRSAAESTLQHEGLSSDEEFDSVYDPSSIASLLTESNLQTSSC